MEIQNLNNKEFLIDKNELIKDNINNIHVNMSYILDNYANKDYTSNLSTDKDQHDIKNHLLCIDNEFKNLINNFSNYQKYKNKVILLQFIIYI